jgi:cytoplasmic iron level regulating protein YaaA (DUF328/UPF0246 family)
MLIVISPAKTLDFKSPVSIDSFTHPVFLKEASELVKTLKVLTPAQLGTLMGISDQLAGLNVARYADWKTPFTPHNAKQSLLAFKGPVYTGIAPESFSERDMTYAQAHLRILSGLYGLLKPLDLIQPYRLEMGTKLANEKGKDLYAFWGDNMTTLVNEELSGSDHPVLINLASNEYFKSIQSRQIEGHIVTPVFKDFKAGKYKIISIYAKRARGLMSAYIIKNQLKKTEQLKAFDWEGYYFSEQSSQGNNLVFLRDEVPV